ncbi:MAG: GC-type dockerin domain-anchored protein [Phycisphaerales bacterium]
MTRSLLAIIAFATAQPALAQYAVHTLEPPAGATDTVVTAIDADGTIVGSANLPTGRIAVLWASFDSPPQLLGTLDGGANSEAISVANGLVVGVSDRDCGQRGAFLWTAAGGLVPAGPSACVPVQPVSVNGSGDVLMQVGEPPLPIVWPLGGGSPRPVDTWGQPATALRLDPDGRVLGASRFHPDATGTERAIEWPASGPGRLLDRLDPDAGGLDAAVDRHASGLIVGFARLGSVSRAAVWNASGEPIDAGEALGPGIRSDLVRINADGLAVGSSSLGAFIWTADAGAQLLEDLVDESGDGWQLNLSQDINDEGIIVGNGTSPSGQPRAFVLVEGGLACRADMDGDGALTIFDFLAFQNLFDGGDARADFDGDGSLTIFDFLAFQNAFDTGC